MNKEKIIGVTLIFTVMYSVYLFSCTALFPLGAGMIFIHLLKLLIIFGIPGMILSRWVTTENAVEKLFVSLFLGVCVQSSVSFALCAVLAERVTLLKIFMVTIAITLLSAGILKYQKKEIFSSWKIHSSRNEQYLVLLLTVIILTVSMMCYDPGQEVISSIQKWTYLDAASCWINCTMEMLEYTSLKTVRYVPYETIFHFPPWITFGNVVFSVSFLEVFQLAGWRYIFLMQELCIGVFLFFILKQYRFHYTVCFFTALFGALNPFFLNNFNPDRNILAVMMSCFLLYLAQKKRIPFFLFGFTAALLFSCGLRHIPLFLACAITISIRKKFTLSSVGLYLAGAMIPVIPAILHFTSGFQGAAFYHPHSFLGILDFKYRGLLNFPFQSQITRNPFYSFPVFINNYVMFVRIMGSIFTAVMIYGCIVMIKKRNTAALPLLTASVIIWGILGVQADWLNKEKMYPLATLFLPALIYFAQGIQRIFNRPVKILIICLLTAIIQLSSQVLSELEFPVDKRVYLYHDLEPEPDRYNEIHRAEILKFPFFSDYSRVFFELEIKNEYFSEYPYNKLCDFNKNSKELLRVNGIFYKLNFLDKKNQNYPNRKVYIDFSKQLYCDLPELCISVNGPENALSVKEEFEKCQINDLTDLYICQFSSEHAAITVSFAESRTIPEGNTLSVFDSSKRIIRYLDTGKYFAVNRIYQFRPRYGIQRGLYPIFDEAWAFYMDHSKPKKALYINDFTAKIYEKNIMH